MRTIELKKYAPIISDKEIGAEILGEIKTVLNSDNGVIIDMQDIRSMATFCAKQIFGALYVEMGSEDFFNKIRIKSATDDVKYIINLGIEKALEDNSFHL